MHPRQEAQKVAPDIHHETGHTAWFTYISYLWCEIWYVCECARNIWREASLIDTLRSFGDTLDKLICRVVSQPTAVQNLTTPDVHLNTKLHMLIPSELELIFRMNNPLLELVHGFWYQCARILNRLVNHREKRRRFRQHSLPLSENYQRHTNKHFSPSKLWIVWAGTVFMFPIPPCIGGWLCMAEAKLLCMPDTDAWFPNPFWHPQVHFIPHKYHTPSKSASKILRVMCRI